jgi:hypothetical protein
MEQPPTAVCHWYITWAKLIQFVRHALFTENPFQRTQSTHVPRSHLLSPLCVNPSVCNNSIRVKWIFIKLRFCDRLESNSPNTYRNTNCFEQILQITDFDQIKYRRHHKSHAIRKPSWFILSPNFFACDFLCCILRGPGGERIVDIVPGGTELELQLRRGVGQASLTRNNPHVTCIGVY